LLNETFTTVLTADVARAEQGARDNRPC